MGRFIDTWVDHLYRVVASIAAVATVASWGAAGPPTGRIDATLSWAGWSNRNGWLVSLHDWLSDPARAKVVVAVCLVGIAAGLCCSVVSSRSELLVTRGAPTAVLSMVALSEAGHPVVAAVAFVLVLLAVLVYLGWRDRHELPDTRWDASGWTFINVAAAPLYVVVLVGELGFLNRVERPVRVSLSNDPYGGEIQVEQRKDRQERKREVQKGLVKTGSPGSTT